MALLETMWNSIQSANAHPRYWRFHQSELLADRRGGNLPFRQVGGQWVDIRTGVCKTLCFYFVDFRSIGLSPAATHSALTTYFQEVGTAHARTPTNNKSTSLQAPIQTRGTNSRFLNRLRRGIRSRSELVHRMVTDPQLSLFIMTNAKGSSGHAVAFDSRAQHLHYFDPNAGYFYTDVMPAEVQLRWFIDTLWESQNLFHYKQDYSKGGRALYVYA